MKTYTDSLGVTCAAFQLTNPTLMNTVNGEECGEAGTWAVYVLGNAGRPVLVPDDLFTASFLEQ